MNDDLAGQIRRDLWAVSDLYDEVLEPVRRAAGSHVTTTKTPPLPISAAILDARAEASRDLHYWARFILDEVRDVNGELMTNRIADTRPETLVRFIVIWVDRIVSEFPDDADNLAREVGEHSRALLNLAAPRRREWVMLGRCPLDVDSEAGPVTCGGEVRAGSDEAKCNACGVTAVIQWWERVLMPEASRLITAAELPEFVRAQFGRVIKAPTVRKWIERGVIESSSTDDKGRTLYDKGAVAYALARKELGA
jgi:hypothetical protein